jgi:hypothetical protein
MTHSEHLKKADESYEIRHDNNGNAIHIYIREGVAVVFASLSDLISYTHFAKVDEGIKRYYMLEEHLSQLYDIPEYSFYALEPVLAKYQSMYGYAQKTKNIELVFKDNNKEMMIVLLVKSKDFWTNVGDYEIHYSEHDNSIRVYNIATSEEIYTKAIE